MRIRPLLAALTLLTAGAAQAQSGATPPDNAAPALGTGQGNDAVNPAGNAPSSVNASGTARLVAMSDLAKGANSFTEGQARTRIAGAGFGILFSALSFAVQAAAQARDAGAAAGMTTFLRTIRQ